MEVKFIQATTIKRSDKAIALQEGCHLKKIRRWYYLIKTTIIEIDYKHKNHKK